MWPWLLESRLSHPQAVWSDGTFHDFTDLFLTAISVCFYPFWHDLSVFIKVTTSFLVLLRSGIQKEVKNSKVFPPKFGCCIYHIVYYNEININVI